MHDILLESSEEMPEDLFGRSLGISRISGVLKGRAARKNVATRKEKEMHERNQKRAQRTRVDHILDDEKISNDMTAFFKEVMADERRMKGEEPQEDFVVGVTDISKVTDERQKKSQQSLEDRLQAMGDVDWGRASVAREAEMKHKDRKAVHFESSSSDDDIPTPRGADKQALKDVFTNYSLSSMPYDIWSAQM